MPHGPADLVFHGGTVYTCDPVDRIAQAAAVRDGIIIAVGSEEDVRAQAGPAAQSVSLAGRMLVPGFQDAHVHPVSGGLRRNRCNLEFCETAAESLAAIGTYAQENSHLPWILGGGWSMAAFPRGVPTRDQLDAVVGGRPAYLPNRDGHSAWVSTRALEMAGVARDTPDPADGRIERDSGGSPAGALHEGAMDLVKRIIPDPTPQEWHKALLTAQAYLHSLGITGWQDAAVDGPGRMISETYRAASMSGELTARVVGALWWDRAKDIDQAGELAERRARLSAGRFRATTVKIMLDGVCETFTASMLDPYLGEDGQPTCNRGIDFIDPAVLPGYVTELDRLGFQVHFHALGDRAVRQALDAVEAAQQANGRSDNRHHLAHIQVVHPDDVPRFRRLGAVANAQPLWACNERQMTELTIPFLGPERTAMQYPFGSLRRQGAQLAFGSDWSVSSPDPLEEIHVAVNRTAADRAGGAPFLPEERLDLPAALRAFTMGSAYVNHCDDVTGSIEVGKRADLAVVDRDLFEIPTAAIAESKVIMTVADGAVVYAGREL